MIKALLQVGGRPMILIGLSGENVTRLAAGEPIRFDGAPLGWKGRIGIVYGRTEADIRTELERHGFPLPDGAEGEDLVDKLCREIATRQEAVDRPRRRSPGWAAHRLALRGEIDGLRTALCLVQGWSPQEEAGHEGKADELVRARHPEVYGPQG